MLKDAMLFRFSFLQIASYTYFFGGFLVGPQVRET